MWGHLLVIQLTHNMIKKSWYKTQGDKNPTIEAHQQLQHLFSQWSELNWAFQYSLFQKQMFFFSSTSTKDFSSVNSWYFIMDSCSHFNAYNATHNHLQQFFSMEKKMWHFYTKQVSKHWHRSPKDVVEPSSLGILKSHLGIFPGNGV